MYGDRGNRRDLPPDEIGDGGVFLQVGDVGFGWSGGPVAFAVDEAQKAEVGVLGGVKLVPRLGRDVEGVVPGDVFYVIAHEDFAVAPQDEYGGDVVVSFQG